ncbi:MAG: Fic family protein [Anaerolineales bacterium]|uniref:Fic family protein n=1 Tax=Candidatus Villigracilis proximus TaxID=3140683 RepID=UPI0031376AE7|nr:Fic family protein [Anaerolineales bacterium]
MKRGEPSFQTLENSEKLKTGSAAHAPTTHPSSSPPADAILPALSDIAKFIHTDDTIPPAIKAGLVHAKFETIHLFLDGNGRTGRMLIMFCLWKSGTLENPVLFLSSYFKKYQTVYYQRLEKYHQGQIYPWPDFFWMAWSKPPMKQSAWWIGSHHCVKETLETICTLGKRAFESASQVLSMLYSQPVVNVALVQNGQASIPVLVHKWSLIALSR